MINVLALENSTHQRSDIIIPYINLQFYQEQAGAELGQTQVKLEIVNDVAVKVRI